MMKRTVGMLLAPVWLAGMAFAQESKVRVCAGVFPGGGGAKLELLLADEISSMPIEPWDGKLSPEFQLPRLPLWRFGTWKSVKDAAGKTVKTFSERGRVKPDPAGRQWLLFFSNGGKESPLVVKSFAADDGSIKEGGTMVLNLSRFEVGGKLKDTPFQVLPNQHAFVNPGTKRGEQYPVLFAYAKDGGSEYFIRTTWFHGQDLRRVAMVIQPENSPAPKLFTLSDRPEPKVAEAKAN